MSEVKISQLPGASTLTGAETVPVVQNGVTARTTVQDIANKANPYNYTPENAANKSTNVENDASSDVKYPSVKAVKTYTDSLVAGLLDDRGNFTPQSSSPGAWPTTGGSGAGQSIKKGDLWFCNAIGFLGTTPVVVGTSFRALTDSPGQTATNWDILDAGLGYIPENSANKSADGTFNSTNNTNYPTTQAVKTYVDSKTSQGASLQTVTNSTNRSLTDGLNFQGTNSGPSSTAGKNNINAFGTQAASGYTGAGPLNALGNATAQNSSGVRVNALGNSAAESNQGSNVNAFGNAAALLNTGSDVNAFGNDAASGGASGSNVNAFGNGAGIGNTRNNVNLFGPGAVATGDNQTVFARDSTTRTIIDFNLITGQKIFLLPNQSGTLALTSDISTPSLQTVTTQGAVTTTNITSENANGNKIEAKSNASGNNSSAALTHDGSKGTVVLKTSGGGTTTIMPTATGTSNVSLQTGSGTLAFTTDVTMSTVTTGTNRNLANGNNYQGTGAGMLADGVTTVSGSNKIHFGANAGRINNGDGNITLGQNSGAYTQNGATVAYGSSNVAIGPNALSNSATTGTIRVGTNNIAIGNNAGQESVTNIAGEATTNKTLIGNNAGKLNNAQNEVIAVGTNSSAYTGNGNITSYTFGANNISIGPNAGACDIGVAPPAAPSAAYTQGTNNVFIGPGAGLNSTGSRNVIIGGGSNAPALSASGMTNINSGGPRTFSNQFNVGNGLSGGSGGKGFRLAWDWKNFDSGVATGDNEYAQLNIPRAQRYNIPNLGDQLSQTILTDISGVNVFTLSLTVAELTTWSTNKVLLPAITTGVYVIKSVSIAANTIGSSATLYSSAGRTLNISYSSGGANIASFSNFGNAAWFQTQQATATPTASTEATMLLNNSVNATLLGGALIGGTTGFNITLEYFIVPVYNSVRTRI